MLVPRIVDSFWQEEESIYEPVRICCITRRKRRHSNFPTRVSESESLKYTEFAIGSLRDTAGSDWDASRGFDTYASSAASSAGTLSEYRGTSGAEGEVSGGEK